MIRRGSWMFVLLMLFAFAVLARADDNGTKPSDAKPDADIAKGLAAVQKQGEDTAQLLKKLTEQIDRMAADHAAELKKLRDRLEKLELDVVRLENAAGDKGKRAFSLEPQPGQQPQGQPAPRGTLRLENTYSLPMSVWVDGAVYTLQPGEHRLAERSAGAFSYEAPGAQARVNRTLAPGETFVIRVYGR
jgi:TolA-binding protein